MPPLRSIALALLGSSLALAACSGGGGAREASSTVSPVDESSDGPHLCAALRGNGELIYAHFASLARLVEELGLFDGMAGGSSSTITMFVYESILKNPALRECGGATCSDDETRARAALLLKSVRGWAEAVGESDGVLGDDGILQLVQAMQSQGVDGLLATDPAAAAQKIRELLSPDAIQRLKVLVNPELLAMLDEQDPQLLAYNVKEVTASIEEFGHFSVDDNRLFFRPGLVDFDGAAGTTFARAGDFYAGYGPSDADAMRAFLDACAAPTKGLLWIDPNGGKDAAHTTTSDGTTCGDRFAAMASAFLGASDPNGPTYPSRVDEPVGGTLTALAATSVVTGAGIQAYADGLTAYRSGRYPQGDVPFDIHFDDVRFGYWGSSDALGRVLANGRGYTDEKTRKAISLGTATWRDVLSRSPAEPGLSRLRELPDGSLAAGGWPDLAPVLALKNLGCDRVVYVTRRQPESVFAIGVATKLGMTAADQVALYDLGKAQSGFTTSLREATATWCTNWNAFADSQQDPMAADAYAAPLETRDPFFASYAGVVASTGFAGCTPGVTQ
jgi:hypothetical protein